MNRAARRRADRLAPTNPSPLAVTFSSNAPWAPTGYGTQTKQVVTRMAADGHHVAVAANYGLEATMTTWEGIDVFPKGYDGYSQDILSAYFRDWSRQHPDDRAVLFTLYDAWVFSNPALDDIPIVSWVPIDHLPVPPKVADWCRRPNVTPVAMSYYGGEQLTRAGIDHVVIPHGIETRVFTHTPTVEDGNGVMRTGRELMSIPEGVHLTGIVNANKGTAPVRKAFAEQLLAWSIFAFDKPDAMVYLHTEKSGGMGGIPFDPLLESLALRPDQYRFVNQYLLRTGIPVDVMAAIYSGLDVLLAPTLGEGFGLTVAECQSVGTRVIVNDFSAQPELVGDGWKVGGQPLWDPAQNAWFNTPSIPDMVAALNESYEQRGEGPSAKARAHIVDNYDADMLYATKWRPFLTTVGT